MRSPFLIIAGLAILAMVVYALVSGKIMTRSRGFKAQYYYRDEQPFLYYAFLMAYLLAGVLVLSQTL